MHSTKSTHGLCMGCLNNGNFELLHSKKSNFCIICQKQPPYSLTKIHISISSPLKSEISSQRGHNITKKIYRLIDKQQIKSMRKSFLSSTGKLIKKIIKLFQQNQTQNDLIAFLNKKATSMSSFDREKMLPKVTKSTNIVYIFIGEKKIIGAFHSQAVNIDASSSIWEEQSGIFFSNKHPNLDLQFARVKSDLVGYSSKSKTIKFGSPSSLQITFEKVPKLTSQIKQDFQWTQCFIYRL